MYEERPLTLEDRYLLEPLWEELSTKHHLLFAEYSFANNYLFREWHSYTILNIEKPLVKGKFLDGTYYLIPTFSPTDFADHAFSIMKALNACLFPIPSEWLSVFPESIFQFTSNPGEADYLYTKEKMASLSGRALSSRRNLIHQLENNYDVRSEPLSSNNLSLAYQILESWQQTSSAHPEENDFQPCKEALDKFEELGFFGRLVFTNEEPSAFSVGEFMNNTKALLHFAKSRKEIKGITPFLYRDFAIHLPDHIQWINLEQDLGNPSLRQAKQAYQPDKLVEKWHVTSIYL